MKTAEPLPCLAGVSMAEGASVSETKILGELSHLLKQSSELDKCSPTVIAYGTARICGASTSLTMIDDLPFLDERNTWSLTPRDTSTKRDTLDGPMRLSHRRSNHQWIVFKEPGIPYAACKNMHDLMTMIKEAAHGAVWREVRLTHGDLSLTNLLWYQGQTLVTDWEVRDDEQTRYARKGTPAYMAVEASAQQGLYRRGDTQEVAFKHNPIHDLESLWRIMMWTFLGSVSSLLLGSMSPAQVHSQWTAYRLRFPNDRIGFSVLGAESRGPFPTCSLKDLPQALAPVTASIGVLARLLQEWHVSPENVLPPSVEYRTFTNSHAEFCSQLDKMLEELGETPYGPVMRLSVL